MERSIYQPLAESAPFAAIDFDSLLKGDAVVVSYGSEAPMTSHVITTPLELWEAQDENGHKTILNFD